jgi:hypothetical protein
MGVSVGDGCTLLRVIRRFVLAGDGNVLFGFIWEDLVGFWTIIRPLKASRGE